MTALIRCATQAAVLLLMVGCEVLTQLVQPIAVRVSLVNSSDYDVEVRMFISDEQDLPEFVLTEVGDELSFTIPAGESLTFARSCDELQAIVIDDADLLVLGGLGPEANSDVLRDGDDFRCGSTIIFTFLHSPGIMDFRIATLVQ